MLTFDSLSVKLRLNNMWSLFKIPFYLVLPHLVLTHFNFWGPYAAFHGMAITWHIKGSMMSAVWTYLPMFLNSKCYKFPFWCWNQLKQALAVVNGVFHFPVPYMYMNLLKLTKSATFSNLPWQLSKVVKSFV
jgi:hypothetical protein